MKDEFRLQLDMLNNAVSERPDLTYVNRLVSPLASKDELGRATTNLGQLTA
jgi:hypothetical protein